MRSHYGSTQGKPKIEITGFRAAVNNYAKQFKVNEFQFQIAGDSR